MSRLRPGCVQDAWAGGLFALAGVGMLVVAGDYPAGSAARMGPGYFPLLLGILLAVLGAAVMFKAMVVETPDGQKIGKFAWKPLFFIIASNLLFGILLGGLPSVGLPAMGLIAGIFGLTFVASLAGERFKFMEVLILSVILSIGSYLAFIVLLKLQFPVWPTFITG